MRTKMNWNQFYNLVLLVLGLVSFSACRLTVTKKPVADIYYETGYYHNVYYDYRFDVIDQEITGHWGSGDYQLQVSQDAVYGYADDELVDLEVSYFSLSLSGTSYCGRVDIDIDPYTLELDGYACGSYIDGSFLTSYDAENYLQEEFLNYASKGFPEPVRSEVESFISYLND